MNSAKLALTILSSVLTLAAAPPYILDTVRGKTRPERATWAILTTLSVIALASQLAAGANWSVVFTVCDALVGLAVFALSIRHGVAGWTRQDQLAALIAGLGVALALLAKSPLYSLAGVIIADASGMALTVRKGFTDPGSETSIAWALAGSGALLAALTVNSLSVSQLAYPIYVGLANYAVVAAQYLGYARLKQRKRA